MARGSSSLVDQLASIYVNPSNSLYNDQTAASNLRGLIGEEENRASQAEALKHQQSLEILQEQGSQARQTGEAVAGNKMEEMRLAQSLALSPEARAAKIAEIKAALSKTDTGRIVDFYMTHAEQATDPAMQEKYLQQAEDVLGRIKGKEEAVKIKSLFDQQSALIKASSQEKVAAGHDAARIAERQVMAQGVVRAAIAKNPLLSSLPPEQREQIIHDIMGSLGAVPTAAGAGVKPGLDINQPTGEAGSPGMGGGSTEGPAPVGSPAMSMALMAAPQLPAGTFSRLPTSGGMTPEQAMIPFGRQAVLPPPAAPAPAAGPETGWSPMSQWDMFIRQLAAAVAAKGGATGEPGGMPAADLSPPPVRPGAPAPFAPTAPVPAASGPVNPFGGTESFNPGPSALEQALAAYFRGVEPGVNFALPAFAP